MSEEHIQVVFRGDQVFNIVKNYSYFPPDPKASLKGAEDGEYVLVNCLIALVSSDGQSACKDVSALKASVLSQTPSPGKEAQKSVEVSEFAPSGLSKAQRKQVIDAFGSSNKAWAWKYATVDVKSILSETLSKEDMALQAYQNALKRYGEDSNYLGLKAGIQEALTLAPEINGLRCELGKAAIKNGRIEEAVSLFSDEISKASAPKLLTAHSYLSAIFAAQGKDSAANHHANLGMQTKEFQKMPSKLSPEVVAKINTAVRNQDRSPARVDYHQDAGAEPGANPETDELEEAPPAPEETSNRNSKPERYGCLTWAVALISFFIWGLTDGKFKIGSDAFFMILIGVAFVGGIIVQFSAFAKRIYKK